MTKRNVCVLVLLAPLFSVSTQGQKTRSEPPYRPGELCDEIVTTVYPEWHAWMPRQKLARVEVRNCRVGESGFLQIAAWTSHASEPGLVVDTKRMTIVKLAMAGNVFVLQTAGASSDVVQVVYYKNGTPHLAFSDATRADVHIDMTAKKVILRWPQEKGPERVYEFPTGEY